VYCCQWTRDRIKLLTSVNTAVNLKRYVKGGEFPDCGLRKGSKLYSWTSRYIFAASRKQSLDT
jgi:hypothetical protein